MVSVCYLVLFFSLHFLFYLHSSNAMHDLTSSQSLRDGKTLVSQDGTFELGFFSPVDSKNRYVGLWHKKVPTLARRAFWVSNRDSPLNDTSGILRMGSHGNFVLFDCMRNVVWSTNVSRVTENPVLELLDSGNLVVKDGDSTRYLWQSFNYPSDALLPGMKLGWDLTEGLNRYLSSWKKYDDPSVGDLTYEVIDIYGYPENALRKGSVRLYRTGPWNGLEFNGIHKPKTTPFVDKFVNNEEEVTYMYEFKDNSIISLLVINQTMGNDAVQQITWVESTLSWNVIKSWPKDLCDNYNTCGAYGICDIEQTPICSCLDNCVEIYKSELSYKRNFIHSCQRPLNCNEGDGFKKLLGLKLPTSNKIWVNKSMDLKECRFTCLKNCSCIAYTSFDITGDGSGCVIWSGELNDIRTSKESGQDLYIRTPASALDKRVRDDQKGGKRIKMIVSLTLVSAGMLVGLGGFLVWSRRKSKGEKDNIEVPLFSLITIATSTDKFSLKNKLGEGGFGPVYKGKLGNGQEIAVKRLSKKSSQGDNEFMNEVQLLSKLQHKNLVRILGCCIEGEEKMLIYEYMPNKSLDSYVFDNTKRNVLDWPKRFQIILGIARGLLYLHQDSRLRIIHRDLKASNILLDGNMDPKISDFGMARIFGADQMEGNTARVVGTYGYMSPEYAIDGQFSVKSDVFSFGVLLLELVSGQKNRGFYHPDHDLNLLGHAWKLWKEDQAFEMIDKFIGYSENISEALRCIHVGLLCVQQHAIDRPIMSSVLMMLSSENAVLPNPQMPGFFTERSTNQSCSDLASGSYVSNEMSMTLFEGR